MLSLYCWRGSVKFNELIPTWNSPNETKLLTAHYQMWYLAERYLFWRRKTFQIHFVLEENLNQVQDMEKRPAERGKKQLAKVFIFHICTLKLDTIKVCPKHPSWLTIRITNNHTFEIGEKSRFWKENERIWKLSSLHLHAALHSTSYRLIDWFSVWFRTTNVRQHGFLFRQWTN